MDKKYGFIGCGNMGSALVKAAVKTDRDIYVNDRNYDKAYNLAVETGATYLTISEIAKTCDVIFLGVKPQAMASMLDSIRATLNKREDRFVLVTMAAGIEMKTIRQMVGDYPVIRIMPNLAVACGEGMTLYSSIDVTDEEIADFVELMKESGKLLLLEEKLIDAGCAISGCGPAFVFMFIEALSDGGVRCGLPRQKAIELAAQTLLGSSKLLMETGKHPGRLKDEVTSPAGSTIEGVLALEDGAFRSTVAEAVISSYEKNLKLK